MGARAMYLDTLKTLTAAIALYEDEGFETIGAYAESEIARYPEFLPAARFMKKNL